jgi:hypothetical protein
VLLNVALKASARQTTFARPVVEPHEVFVAVVDKTPVIDEDVLVDVPGVTVDVPGVTVESPLDLQPNNRAVNSMMPLPALIHVLIYDLDKFWIKRTSGNQSGKIY